ncbi:hypothetical protein Acr_29g0004740 [Actinidia rufa]|uniref:DUF6817 domain-containing protein n=1 Tax=Actinidia rufa TaxID=165716 RepID=A0A7J0HE71_9ERIC|nr:hypothetical protein Acr_29g0004740 [Actinidia rufa]
MPSSSWTQQYLSGLLESARPFLRGELELIDAKLPALVAVLRSVGAGECWHKHGSFLDHLLDVYRILKLWKAPDSISLCGLFHSAYSNSYVNLAIFDPLHRSRRSPPPRWCRRRAIDSPFLHRPSPKHHPRRSALPILRFRTPPTPQDAYIKHTNKVSEISLRNAKERGLFDEDEAWRKKLQSIVPADGVKVKHIKTGEDVLVSRRVIAVFLLITMADFSDQIFGFQDVLFENSNGRLEYSGNNFASALWPGDGKPGLWMNSISRMGTIYSLIVREEEIFVEKRRQDRGHNEVVADRDEEIELVIPPVFEKCTRVLDAEEHIGGRDLYWEAVCDGSKIGLERSEELLVRCVEKNPFIGEPHVVLGQLYLSKGRFEEAEKEAEKGLTLLLEWGSPWDKRMSWQGWIAWARVLVMKAKERSWPDSSWGILNLGLVR